MARRALRDTFGTEPIYGVEVRRIIKAGTVVPPHYKVDAADVEETDAVQPFLAGVSHTVPMMRPQGTPPDYDNMTLSQLKEAAGERGIAVTADAKKADIVAALK